VQLSHGWRAWSGYTSSGRTVWSASKSVRAAHAGATRKDSISAGINSQLLGDPAVDQTEATF